MVWHVFKETCTAKMIQRTAFSSPHSGTYILSLKYIWNMSLSRNTLKNWKCFYVVFCIVFLDLRKLLIDVSGQAFVIFKKVETADMVVRKLAEGCLLLSNGR